MSGLKVLPVLILLYSICKFLFSVNGVDFLALVTFSTFLGICNLVHKYCTIPAHKVGASKLLPRKQENVQYLYLSVTNSFCNWIFCCVVSSAIVIAVNRIICNVWVRRYYVEVKPTNCHYIKKLNVSKQSPMLIIARLAKQHESAVAHGVSPRRETNPSFFFTHVHVY